MDTPQLSPWLAAFLLAACLLGSAFCSGAEIGFMTVSRVRLRRLAAAGERRVASLLALLDRVVADGGTVHPEAWWGELLLPADDGEPAPARGLVLPGTDAARWFCAWRAKPTVFSVWVISSARSRMVWSALSSG